MIDVLVVDDSALMRKIISEMINSDKGMNVVSTAKDGRDALAKMREHKPDVITMDLVMEEMDGITAIKRIMKEHPTPILVVSAYTEKNSKIALAAISAGAVDFIEKPSGEVSLDMKEITDQLLYKIKAVSKANIRKPKTVKKHEHRFSSSRDKIVVIGSSTGGPQTLEVLLTSLPKEMPVPILIAQHMPPLFTRSFAERLNPVAEIMVKEAEDGEELRKGVAYIAPGGMNMVIEKGAEPSLGRIRITESDADKGARPSVDRLFHSAVEIYKENTIGVILTGMGRDGTLGCEAIKNCQGTVIAESDETCIIYGMPKTVIEAGLADMILSIDKIPVALIQAVDV